MASSIVTSVQQTSDGPLFLPPDPGKCVSNHIGRRWATMASRLLKGLMRDLRLQFKGMIATFMARDSEARPNSDTSTSHLGRPATETESPGLGFALIISARIVPSAFGYSVLEMSLTTRRITSNRTDLLRNDHDPDPDLSTNRRVIRDPRL